MALIQPVIFCTAPSVPIQPADLKAAMTVVSSALQSGATPVVVGSEFLFASHVPGQKFSPLKPGDSREGLLDLLVSIGGLVIPGTRVDVEGGQPVNYAPVYLNGKELRRVYKQVSGGSTEPKWYKPSSSGPDHPDVFTIHPAPSSEMLCGVEICNDIGNMKAALKHASMSAWPELFVMSSYGMAMRDIFTLGPTVAGYECPASKGKEYKRTKYTIGADVAATDMLGEMALHTMKPGVIIQADGNRCRVVYKHPMVTKFTIVPPLKSAPLQSSGHDRGTGQYFASIHVFPAVDLNPLKSYWL